MLRGTADMYVGRAALHVERGDLVAARSDLGRGRAVGEHAGLPQNPYRWRVVMAQVCEAEGDLEAAVGLLDEAERRYEGDFSPEVRPVAALRARLWIRQGRVDEALDWAESRGCPWTTTSATCTSSSTSRWPGPSSPHDRTGDGPRRRRSSSSGGCWALRGTGAVSAP